jgi:Carboxypeptidase regulatory-like domain
VILSTRNALLVLMMIITGLMQSVYAQTFRGGISGTVTDSSGAAVPNAHVQALAIATGVAQNTTTTSAGGFEFPDMPLGTYKISADATGFQSVEVNGVTVSAGVIYSLPIKLAVAQTTSTIEVSAASLALDTASVTQTAVIPTRVVQDVPLNGRDYTQLISITPGFAGYSASGGVAVGSVNGMRSTQINWQIDGSDNNDLFFNIPALNQGGLGGIAGLVMPMDAIDQFSFVTSSTSETGRNPAGTVNIAIKSGTNQIHGTAYYFNRNEALAAKTPFAPAGTAKNEVRAQEEGGSVGGPVVKDRSFYFLAFEYQNNVIGNQVSSTEPSHAYQVAAQNVLAYYGVPANSVSQNLLNTLWPASALNGPAASGNYFNPAKQTGYSFNTQLKFDETLTQKNMLSVRIFTAQGLQHGPVGSYLSPYYEVDYHRVHNGAITYNFLPTPRLSNQLTAGFSFFNGHFADSITSYNPASLGLNTGLTTAEGAPEISLSGNFDPIGVTTPQGRNDITGHLTDALAYSIDDYAVDRVIKVYTDQAGDLRLYEEQLCRWKKLDSIVSSGRRWSAKFSRSNGILHLVSLPVPC